MANKIDDLKLGDVGEFELLNKYVIPKLRSNTNLVGDDCAFVDFPPDGYSLVITTDAGPKPIFFNTEKPYFYIWGWYTVLANVSDLASTGCFPLSLSLAIEASSDMKVSEFEDFFDGAKAASETFNIPISGGNIKANKQFISNATAIGYLKKNQIKLRRDNCRPNDIVISIGENGRYITSYLKYLDSNFDALSPDEQKKLMAPTPQLSEMQILNSGLNITAASDNSDGILGSLWNIAERSNCAFLIDLDSINIPEYIASFATKNKIDPWNLFFFWGDWQVIITIAAKEFAHFEEIANKSNIKYTVLGKAIEGNPALLAKLENKKRVFNILRNENFSKKSYNQSIKEHIDYLLHENIFKL